MGSIPTGGSEQPEVPTKVSLVFRVFLLKLDSGHLTGHRLVSRLRGSATQRGGSASDRTCSATDGEPSEALEQGRREVARHLGTSDKVPTPCREVALHLNASDKVRHYFRVIGENHQSLPHSDALCPRMPRTRESRGHAEANIEPG